MFKIIKIKKYIIPSILIMFLISLIIFSKTAFLSAQNGFKLWLNIVFPSLLPFLITINIVMDSGIIHKLSRYFEKIMKPIFNLPGSSAFAMLAGLSSGYPIGAKITTDLYKQNLCTKRDAENMLAFVNNSGPLFVAGAIGAGMFGDTKTGVLLLVTHWMSALTIAIINSILTKTLFKNQDTDIIHQNRIKSNTFTKIDLNNLGNKMKESIISSINTLFIICGYIVLFSVIISILNNTSVFMILSGIISPIFQFLHIPTNLSTNFISGIIELTNGVDKIAKAKSILYINKIPLIAFLLGFGGFCVHMQVMSITNEVGLKLKTYFTYKFIQGLLASAYTYIAIIKLPIFSLDIVPIFKNYYSPIIPKIMVNNALISPFTINLYFYSIAVVLVSLLSYTLLANFKKWRS